MIKESEHRRSPEFVLDGVVPWGRRLGEYQAFFALDDLAAIGPVLDAGGGPSSFAAEAARLGLQVVAADPIYDFSGEAIAAHFEATAVAMREGMRRAAYRFDWRYYGSEEAIHKLRREALSLFLADFEVGKAEGRYITAALPRLPFVDGAFKLALSSHLLFLYGDVLDFDFHVAAMRELLRVAEEVRVFPLFNLDGRPSSHLPGVMGVLAADGAQCELRDVPFEFQKGARRMLRVWR
jgi:SAM-dependent methyltransferase